MTDIIQLKTAKYKGVEFAIESMPTTGGNRLIKFNYPGSNKQSIEVQGKAPRSFTLTAIIPHENYYQERDNLLRVLEDGQTGVLTHPTFGDVENVINGVYSLTETINDLGRAKIVIPFEVDDAPGIPQQSGDLVSQVQQQSDVLNTQLAADAADNYEISSMFPANFTDGLNNVAAIAAAFTDVSLLQTPTNGDLSGFQETLNAFSSSAGELISDPSLLGSSLGAIFEDLNNLYDTPEQAFDVIKSLFGFGDNDPIAKTNTVGRIERNNNRGTLRTNMKTQALSYAYLNAAQLNYQTTDDLDQVQTDLEAQYLDIRDNQLVTNETQEQIDRLRVQAQDTLDQVRVNTSQVITIETRRQPLSVLVYSYYGSTELTDTIAELNNIKENAFVEGSVQVLAV